MNPLQPFLERADLAEIATAWGLRLGAALLIFLLGLWLSRLLARGIARLVGRRFDKILAEFIGKIVFSGLTAAVIIASLDELGVDTTSLLAILGAAGLAIGLALKDSLSNFAAGVLLIALRPFRAGDFVEAGGTMGTVEQLRLFQTLLISPNGQEVTIPNGTITRGTIINYSIRPTRRVDLTIGVSYDDDLRQVRAVIEEVVRGDGRVLDEPTVSIMVTNLGESSVDFAVRCWTRTSDWWATRCDMLERLKVALDDAGITIPYPQRDVHLHEGAGPARGSDKRPQSAA